MSWSRALVISFVFGVTTWGSTSRFALGQTCPAFPSTGGISIQSPTPNTPFLSGDSIQVTVIAAGFSFTEMVAHWAYGTAWGYSASPAVATLPIPIPADGTKLIRVVALDANGDGREATVQVVVLEDTDQDDVPDATDNCPYLYNPTTQGQGNGQYHVNDKNGDNIGDVCQCADVNGAGYVGDGFVDINDQTAMYNLIWQNPNPMNNRADTNNDGSTDVNDYLRMTSVIYKSCTPICAAYPFVPENNPYWPDNACL